MSSPLAIKIYDTYYTNNKFNHPMYTPVKRRKRFEQSVDSYCTREILANSSHKASYIGHGTHSDFIDSISLNTEENQNDQEMTLSRVKK